MFSHLRNMQNEREHIIRPKQFWDPESCFYNRRWKTFGMRAHVVIVVNVDTADVACVNKYRPLPNTRYILYTQARARTNTSLVVI